MYQIKQGKRGKNLHILPTRQKINVVYLQGFSTTEFSPHSFLAPRLLSHSQLDLPSFGLEPDDPVFIQRGHGTGDCRKKVTSNQSTLVRFQAVFPSPSTGATPGGTSCWERRWSGTDPGPWPASTPQTWTVSACSARGSSPGAADQSTTHRALTGGWRGDTS